MVLKDRRYRYMLFICLFTYLFFQSKLFVKHLIEGKEMEGRVVLRYSWTLRDVSSLLAKKCRLHGLFLPMNESSLKPSFDIIAQITSIAQGISKCAKVIKKIISDAGGTIRTIRAIVIACEKFKSAYTRVSI